MNKACISAAAAAFPIIVSSPSISATLPSSLIALTQAGVPMAATPPTTPLTELSRIVEASGYPDGIGEMFDETERPAPRDLSNALSQPTLAKSDTRPLNNLAVGMFQFLASHEIARSPTNGSEPIAMSVDPSDPFVSSSGQTVIPQDRSQATGGESTPRQQLNDVTPQWDASTVYGSDLSRQTELRSFADGKLKVGPDGGLPLNDGGRPFAGDVRADENPNLQVIHAMFVREHNRLADEIKAECPGCTDLQIFDSARMLVAQLQQKIFYDELLPAFLGTDDLNSLIPDPTVLAGVETAINEFTAAAGRIGHTQVPDTISLARPGEASRSVNLANCFFDAGCLGGASDAEVLYGAFTQKAEPVDTVVSDALRNAQVPGFEATMLIDLFATNINRGRDHGLPDYMTLRDALGFDPAVTLELLLPPEVLAAYAGLDGYGIDLLVGLFAEDRDDGEYLGDTGKALWALQFRNLKDTAPGSKDPEVMAILAPWLDSVSMSWLLSRDTGFGAEVFGGADVFFVPAAVPVPPAMLLSATAVGGLVLTKRLRRRQVAKRRFKSMP